MTRVLVPLAEGFEEVEALTVVDVLRRAEVEVVTASTGADRHVTGKHTITVLADRMLRDVAAQPFDMVVLPGGVPGVPNLAADPMVAQVVQAAADREDWVCAICAAPSVLGDLGLLRDRAATIHPGWRDKLRCGDYSEDAVVRDGKFVTSRGAGTALPFALTLAVLLAGEEKAREVAAGMVTELP
jgi:protein deglycase